MVEEEYDVTSISIVLRQSHECFTIVIQGDDNRNSWSHLIDWHRVVVASWSPLPPLVIMFIEKALINIDYPSSIFKELYQFDGILLPHHKASLLIPTEWNSFYSLISQA